MGRVLNHDRLARRAQSRVAGQTGGAAGQPAHYVGNPGDVADVVARNRLQVHEEELQSHAICRICVCLNTPGLVMDRPDADGPG